MLKLHVTLSRFCLYLLYIYHFSYTFSHAHTEAHTHTSTHVQSAHKTTTRHRSLVESGGRKALLEALHTHRKKIRKKKCQKKTDIPESKEKIRARRASSLAAKLLDYFLRSNKSNINQWRQPATGAWLRVAEERLSYRHRTYPKERKSQTNPIFTNLKKRFEHVELPGNLLDNFLRSNKSNIDQSNQKRICVVTDILRDENFLKFGVMKT